MYSYGSECDRDRQPTAVGEGERGGGRRSNPGRWVSRPTMLIFISISMVDMEKIKKKDCQ